MKTEDLIAALAAGVEPTPPRRLERSLLSWSLPAALAAFAGVWLALGPRADLMVAMQGPTFWLKAAYTLSLAAAGGWLFVRMGRPGRSVGAPLLALGLVVTLAVGLGLGQLSATPPEARMAFWMGVSARSCPLNVLFASALAAPFIFWAARRYAPTRPTLAGAAAGILTGGLGATLYGLHCIESTAAFVSTWYTLGVLLAGAAGALIGRFALRW